MLILDQYSKSDVALLKPADPSNTLLNNFTPMASDVVTGNTQLQQGDDDDDVLIYGNAIPFTTTNTFDKSFYTSEVVKLPFDYTPFHYYTDTFGRGEITSTSSSTGEMIIDGSAMGDGGSGGGVFERRRDDQALTPFMLTGVINRKIRTERDYNVEGATRTTYIDDVLNNATIAGTNESLGWNLVDISETGDIGNPAETLYLPYVDR